MKDYFGYKDKNVVVTGAASGMGKATALMLVELGANVYALDWAEVKAEGISHYIHTDLSNKDSIDEAFKEIPDKIDSYFGIAGISGANNTFMTTVTIDFIANKYITENYLMNRMNKDGSIAYMTSTGGCGWEKESNIQYYKQACEANSFEDTIEAIKKTPFSQLPGTMGYPFAKLALNYYTVYIQDKLASKGVRVNAVLPGSTNTGMTNEFTAMAGGENALLSHNGLNRLATPEEMAQPIVFINSSMANYISGETLTVDYGHMQKERCGLSDSKDSVDLNGILQYIMQRSNQQ